MASRPSVRTQFLIFNLYGDYVFPRRRPVWTGGLLDVLRVLGVGDRAARSTLSRMKQKGWLEASRQGRRSAYRLTPRGAGLLEEGSRRLFGPRLAGWDGRWHLVIYSLPQEMRTLRRELRARLSWLGYGMLLPGIMVAAHSRRERVEAILRELNAERYVHFFTGSQLELLPDREIVGRCWDLLDLNRRYAGFVGRHRGDFLTAQRRRRAGNGPTPEQGFDLRFWVTYEYSSFPRQDPNLPDELLPKDWQGDQAAQLLADYRDMLREPAEAFIHGTLGVSPPGSPVAVEREVRAEETFVGWPQRPASSQGRASGGADG